MHGKNKLETGHASIKGNAKHLHLLRNGAFGILSMSESRQQKDEINMTTVQPGEAHGMVHYYTRAGPEFKPQTMHVSRK